MNMTGQESKIFRKTEIVGTSFVGFDDGVQKAIERARKTLRNVMWFEVKEQRGRITSNGDIEYQITLEIGFQLEEPSP
jgi:flavin-binding protein dodecin